MSSETQSGVLKMPRVNANEDSAIIVSVGFGAGESFKTGDVIVELETTKATVEVEAPFDGTVTDVLVEIRKDYPVGSPILAAEIDVAAAQASDLVEDWDFRTAAQKEDANDTESGTPHVSLKAKMRAKALGVDIKRVMSDTGKITVDDVEAYARRTGKSGPSAAVVAPPRDNTPRERYSSRDALIVGEGGHALTVEDAAYGSGFHIAHKMAIHMNDSESTGRLQEMIRRGLQTAFIGVGGAISNEVRAKLYFFLKEMRLSLPPLVGPGSIIPTNSFIGEATYLLSGATVGPNVTIGDNSIVNHGAVVCHDSMIGSHVHLTPNATVAGLCRIGDYSTIGMSASIMNGVKVGERCLVHNNVAVAQDVVDDAVISVSR